MCGRKVCDNHSRLPQALEDGVRHEGPLPVRNMRRLVVASVSRRKQFIPSFLSCPCFIRPSFGIYPVIHHYVFLRSVSTPQS